MKHEEALQGGRLHTYTGLSKGVANTGQVCVYTVYVQPVAVTICQGV